MTRKEAVEKLRLFDFIGSNEDEEFLTALDMAIKALEQEPSRDMEEIKEIMECDADAETKCKMISNILTAKPHYFEEPQESEEISREEIAALLARESMSEEMTREQAIRVMMNERPHCGEKFTLPEEMVYEAYNVAIAALEQNTGKILDIIRADIASPSYHGFNEVYDDGFNCATRRALQIIDKYMADKEQT